MLGRPELGSLEVGKACDFIMIDVERSLEMSGFADPVAATVFGQPKVHTAVVGGEVIVDNGELRNLDTTSLVQRHQTWSKTLRG